MKVFGTVLLSLTLVANVLAIDRPAANPEWTVMVYMNAKNNLEPDAIDNFLQMAKEEYGNKVQLVVEMGRPKEHYTSDYGPWSGVRRFHIKKGSRPEASQAVMSLPESKGDMGSATTLADFVAWARVKYPAKHFMLIIWNHGQGWRFQLAAGHELRSRATRGHTKPAEAAAVKHPPTGWRSVSFDDDTNNFLYNRDIEDTLRGTHLDVLAFDACLMSMLETAYAFRDVASVMVGSEELEPGAGWPYDGWLKMFAAKPAATPSEVAKMVVSAYQQRYGDIYRTTLSAIDLQKAEKAATELSSFSAALKAALDREALTLRNAREKIRPYGEDAGLKTSIDLVLLLDRFAANTKDKALQASANRVKAAITEAVLANYASSRLTGEYGSHGVAVYFPKTAAVFEADQPDNEGYRLDNTNHPVEFVQKNQWSGLLHAYWEHP